MDEKKLSCVDCAVTNCEKDIAGRYPAFCLTEKMDETVKADALSCYEEPENFRVMEAAAEVECEGYCQWPRVREIAEFAKKMGFRKIGIATCVGLIDEARTAAKIFRSHGFQVYGAACKVGSVDKTDVGLDEKNNAVGCKMCNPILQAKLLNEEGTQLNVVVGLCVGHDSLFMKYSDALVTTLVTKDRVTGHNPAAALYNSRSYFGPRIMGDADRGTDLL
ncbi:MAG: DUF1847 domain-containing protein [Emergencia sp.]|nr:DUF1847 domain-containing protein [Emergencia sp.]